MVSSSGWPISSRISLQVRWAPAGGSRLIAPEIGEPRIPPAGEQVLEVPFALAVAGQHKKAIHVSASPVRVQGFKVLGPVEAEHIGHGVITRLLVEGPERRPDGAAGEERAVLGA